MTRNSGRNTDGTFAPGNPGKPQGARHRATQAALALLDGEAEALTRQAVTMALGGDATKTRNDGEPLDAFTARASPGASGAVCLPHNGRDAIATGKAPDWAQSALVTRHLREKHRTNHKEQRDA